MDAENWWKFFGGGGLALAIIFALTKLFNAPPFKKNGGGRTMMEEIMMIGRTLADNSTKQTLLLEQVHSENKRNGEKLDTIGQNLSIAMERQVQVSKKIDSL